MLTAISSIFVFLIVILIHELGHFTVAKLVGIRVNEFSIGMGPKLFQKTKGDTQYTLRLLPIGGYVSMEGEDEDSSDPRSFSNVPVLSRIAVVAAGAVMNFILAIFIFSIIFLRVGMPSNTIEEVQLQSPAYEAGMRDGDKIIEIDNKKISNWEAVVDGISEFEGEDINLKVLRGDQTIEFKVRPIIDKDNNTALIGIRSQMKKSPGMSIRSAFRQTFEVIGLMFSMISNIFTGQVKLDAFSGPVGVISEIGNQARQGVDSLLFLMAFISINLGFFNLLPIPALDGSRILFMLIELVRGKPIDPKREGMVHFIGFIFLISIMILVTFKDIVNLNG